MGEIMTIKEWKEARIEYDRLQGRPSVELGIQGKSYDCLLDTGAKINVMSDRVLKELTNVVLEKVNVTLRCANNTILETLGQVEVETFIGEQGEWITYTVARQACPDIIGGIDLQRKFGFELCRRKSDDEEIHIGILEAKFGRCISDEERQKQAIQIIQPDNEALKVIKRNRQAFMADDWDIGCTSLVKHKIITNGEPINVKPWRQPMHLEAEIDKTLHNLEENGIIRKCQSRWNMPLVALWKKEKKKLRLCLDFRQLNNISERQAFPMPNTEELLDRLKGARYFSTIDLGSAYYQVELEKSSQEKTAFSTKKGQYCFTRMPFGIAAAPGTFQELMTTVLGETQSAMVYMDDILIYSENAADHYKTLDSVLKEIVKAGLRVNPKKCILLRKEVKFLGHILDKDGIRTDPSKIESIKNFERPKCVKQVRRFLGMCNYYRKFIKGYSAMARALEELCGRNKDKLIWTPACNEAFDELKQALTKTPVLSFPDTDKVFILDTDASFSSIGAVLSQRDTNGRERVIAYGSHSMNAHEKGYCITRKELLAIYYFCNSFKHYLYGRRFILRTDHKAITFMINTKKPITAQFQNWMNYLSSLDIDIQYRKGEAHTNADMLSRMECGSCVQCETQHEDAKTGKIKTRRINTVKVDKDYKWQKDSAEISSMKKNINDGDEFDFRIHEGVVKTKCGKIWIPKDKRSEWTKEIHSMLMHAGNEKMIQYISNGYDMFKLRDIVEKITATCTECQKNKVVTTKTKEQIIVLKANHTFEKIYIDICGPFKETLKRKKYILAIIDHYSKYISLTAIGRQDEETICKVIKENWILRFGAPKEMHIDCGKSFESKTFRNMARSMDIDLCFSSPYHHGTNGLVERQFRTIRDCLNASGNSNWDDKLPELEFMLNATYQKTIKTSPAAIVFGKEIRRERWIDPGGTADNLKSNEVYSTRRTFKVGDKVLVKNEVRAKDKERYDGPYEVKEKIHERRYKLQDTKGRMIDRNVEKIKFLKEGGCQV